MSLAANAGLGEYGSPSSEAVGTLTAEVTGVANVETSIVAAGDIRAADDVIRGDEPSKLKMIYAPTTRSTTGRPGGATSS